MNAIYALVLRSHGNESHRNCRDNKKTINCVLISQSKDQFKCVSVRGCGWECWVHRLQCIPGASLSWNLFFPVETWMWSGQLSWKESFSSNLQSKDGKRQSRHAFAFALHLVQYSPHRSKNNLIVWKTLRMEHSTIYTMDVGRYPSIPMHYAKYHIRVKYCTCEWKKNNIFPLSRPTISLQLLFGAYFANYFVQLKGTDFGTCSMHVSSQEFICMEAATGSQVRINNWIPWKMK